MKKIIVLFCAAIGTLILGCTRNKNSEIEQDHDPIELNNGEKWTVDTAMLENITAMETALDNFKTGEDIAPLQNLMKENIKELTSKCTMQGQAHDELHKWLMPLMQTVDTMDGLESLDRLKQHFITFHTYFE